MCVYRGVLDDKKYNHYFSLRYYATGYLMQLFMSFVFTQIKPESWGRAKLTCLGLSWIVSALRMSDFRIPCTGLPPCVDATPGGLCPLPCADGGQVTARALIRPDPHFALI